MLTILVGSGLSFRLPSVKQLTDEICHGSGWYRANDHYHYSSARNNSNDYDTVKCAIILVNTVKDLVNGHFIKNASRKVTYEDIYSIIRYVEDWGEYPHSTSDPLSTVILERIREKITHVSMNDLELSPPQLAQATNTYIHDVVCARLRNQVDTGYLDSLAECLKSWGRVTIVTLNHDCLLDDKLKAAGIDLQDGFREDVDGVRVWAPYQILDKGKPIKLVKLHGSVGWSWLQRDRIVSGFHPNCNPIVLIGTTTKSSDYPRFIYSDMMRAFDFALRESDHLLVCGYGFMDTIVNEKLREWTCLNKKCRISVIDNKPREEFEGIGIIATQLVDYYGDGVKQADWNRLVANLARE
jgi:hypothetical protein